MSVLHERLANAERWLEIEHSEASAELRRLINFGRPPAACKDAVARVEALAVGLVAVATYKTFLAGVDSLLARSFPKEQ